MVIFRHQQLLLISKNYYEEAIINNVIHIPGTNALNLTDIESIQSFKPTDDGTFAVTIESNVTYHVGKAPLDQAYFFNTEPLKTGDTEKWNSIINAKQAMTVTGKKTSPFMSFWLIKLIRQTLPAKQLRHLPNLADYRYIPPN